MSSRQLDEREMSLLSKGLKFAPAPRTIPVREIVTEVESSIQSLDATTRSEIRNKVTSILACAKPPQSNLSKADVETIRKLKEDDTIIIIKADKGNATVIMDRKTYDEKLETLLSDRNTYQVLDKDPAKACERKMKSLLSKMKERISDRIYREINTTDGITPQLYGTPKIHKKEVPLRPIVSFIGSPTYKLSKHLSFLLSPLVGKSNYHIRNTVQWVETTKQMKLDVSEELISFDVVSLFTSIPTDVAVDVARIRLNDDLQLNERTTLTATDICSLLSFCLTTTEFQCRGKYYRQIHGTAMGSPVSVVVANLVMEHLETRAIATFPKQPTLYRRYVDDIACIMNKDDVTSFHNHLNAQDPNIKFTIERGGPGGLPFLDTLNVIQEDGSIDVSVYRKATHTDQYLDFNSHHPPQHKASVVRTLYGRATKIPSTDSNKAKEEKHVFMTLNTKNGYPKGFIKRNKNRKMKDKNNEGTSDWKGFATLPYVKGVTERIQRILVDKNVRVCAKPVRTLKQMLSRPKDPIPIDKKTGVVYEIPCKDCSTRYIGETGRALSTRVKEHQACVRLGKYENSALAEHANTLGHDVSWNDTKILASNSHWLKRRITEAWMITEKEHVLTNRDCGRKMPESYLPLIK